MNTDKNINESIKFLLKNQKDNGSFLSLTSLSPDNFKNAHECQSVFSTALILSCLNALDGNNSRELLGIKQKAANFLLSQKSSNWSFNYWARGSRQAEEMPYPDDLDDTACALSALYKHNPDLLSGEVLANVVTVLTALEVKEGGPYRTWLVPANTQKAWLDVDLAVNSNIGYFLSLQDVHLESIVELAEKAINDKKYESPYYPHPYPIIYFISRFYRGAKSKEVIDFLLEKQDGDNWGDPLDTALAVLSLLNFGFSKDELRRNIKYLLQNKKKDGSWAASVFYTGINPNQYKGDKNKYYAGTPALTTALCIEAIQRVSEVNCSKCSKGSGASDLDEEGDKIFKEVVKKAKRSFSKLGPDLKKQADRCLKKILESNKDKQIVLLPYFFLNSLNQTLQPDYESKILDLGLANLYGWMAYTIYDDFLDDEGDIQMLSVANVSLREADRIFSQILPETDFANFSKIIFSCIDGANAWEIAHCRTKEKTIASALAHPLPDFSDVANLSDRSLGHALGPIGVLCALGYRIESAEGVAVLEGFRHYIAAKQIHDDMHDWEDDLSKGQINSASAALFSMVNSKLVPKTEKEALQFLQHKFWEETVSVLCKQSFAHLEQSSELFLSAGVSAVFVDRILGPLYLTTEQTIKEQNDAKKFISTYAKGK